ncbi:hypothetical protein Gohar_006334 [Gossypium harknessii]|uniref:Uncharacterized protein n=1 Tax=Gossypium harknessii TaxID=34285 RepID=A0A7J9GD44_9ROSI|nr:hypothetical protein [Gossypium harknessii]
MPMIKRGSQNQRRNLMHFFQMSPSPMSRFLF